MYYRILYTNIQNILSQLWIRCKSEWKKEKKKLNIKIIYVKGYVYFYNVC